MPFFFINLQNSERKRGHEGHCELQLVLATLFLQTDFDVFSIICAAVMVFTQQSPGHLEWTPAPLDPSFLQTFLHISMEHYQGVTGHSQGCNKACLSIFCSS